MSMKPGELFENRATQRKYNLIVCIFRVFCTFFYNGKAEGLERIPLTGPLIIVSNHMSNIDPPLLGGFAGKVRSTKYIIKNSLFKLPIFGKLFKEFGFIGVDRTDPSKDMGAFKAMMSALKKGEGITVFPEGTRSKTGEMQEAKAGVAFIAHKTGAPILISRIFNTYKFPWTYNLRVVFSHTIKFEEVEGKDIKEQYADFAKTIMAEIAKVK